jgi:hypothetical protein
VAGISRAGQPGPAYWKRILPRTHPRIPAGMLNLATTYQFLGKLEEAEALAREVVQISETMLGSDNPATLSSIGTLSSTLWRLGMSKEAEKLDLDVLERRKKIHGMDHPATLTSVANLAVTYLDQQRLEEAEELQVLEKIKAVSGKDHPGTLVCMNNLAWIWKDQGHCTKAIDMMIQCAKMLETKLGPDHPDIQESRETAADWSAEN